MMEDIFAVSNASSEVHIFKMGTFAHLECIIFDYP